MIVFKNKEYSNDELQKIINESTSISEILRKMDVRDCGANHTKLSKYLKDNEFDTSTLVGRKICRYNSKGIPKKRASETFVRDSGGNSVKIKKRLLNLGIKEYKCEKCGNSEYDGDIIPLELHHVNGDHFDNRLENLLLLCPICHARTSNFRGKHKQYDLELIRIAKENSIGKMEQLIENENKMEIKNRENIVKKRQVKIKTCKYCGKEFSGSNKTYCSIECSKLANGFGRYEIEDIKENAKKCHTLGELGKIYGITDNGIKKHLKKYGILDEVKKSFIKVHDVILQYSIDMQLIKTWTSDELKNDSRYSITNIRACCNNGRKTAHGFIWKYIEDVSS